MQDLISRQNAIETIRKLPNAGIHWFVSAEAVFDALLKLPSVQSEQRWIPFKSKLPEDGQRILITVNFLVREKVQADEFYIDADGAYLDGMYKIGTEAVAWMPFSEPYKEEQK